MKKKSLSILAMVAGVALGAMLLTDVAYTEELRSRGKSKATAKRSFTVSGIYTGSLKGEMKLNGNKYVVTDKTRIYVVDKGLKQDVFVNKTAVYVSGWRENGKLVAKIIIVNEKSHRTSSLRSNANRIPSPMNPNVGEIPDGEAN